MSTHTNPTVRHDMVLLFEVTDGNPNGDPDAGNRPRMDDETGHGLVTDVALKRKIRDTIALAADGLDGYGVFVEAGYALNPRLEESYTTQGLKASKSAKISAEQAKTARDWLAQRYVDLRLFGGVLSVGNTQALGQLRGPLQVTFARSIDPVFPSDHAITRITQTRQEDIDRGETTEMGGKWTVPYALYRAQLYYSANRARQTGVTERDIELLYKSLEMMFEHDRSATRGTLTPRGLHVFTHPDSFGAAPAHLLTERVRVTRTGDDPALPPRSFSDYQVTTDEADLPGGVTYTRVF
jgi:CRISPR-associated protein Csd2